MGVQELAVNDGPETVSPEDVKQYLQMLLPELNSLARNAGLRDVSILLQAAQESLVSD